MWLAHLLLFRGAGLANWIGLVVVVQNFVSSLFNSHLFDFVEGWIYVLGVGIAGGISLRARNGVQLTQLGVAIEPGCHDIPEPEGFQAQRQPGEGRQPGQPEF